MSKKSLPEGYELAKYRHLYGLIFLLSISFLYFFRNSPFLKSRYEFLLAMVIPFGFGIAIIYVWYFGAETEIDLEIIRNERVKIEERIEAGQGSDIFQTIQLSLNQLSEYYTINKGQAKRSFQFSIAAIVCGSLTILVGIFLYYFNINKIEVIYITGISGVLLEFIGGAYFVIYKKSLEQVNFFFSQLIKNQDTMLAINIAKNMEIEKRMPMEEKIIQSLLERSLK